MQAQSIDSAWPRSWIELQEILFADSWDERIGRHRLSHVFHGMANTERALRPSIERLGERCHELELPLLRAFHRYARYARAEYGAPMFLDDQSIWSLLAIAQHHGLPTRLLDFTFSPYVALHFVTEDSALFDRDGVIWSVNFVKARSLLPRALSELLDEEDANVFTCELLSRAANTIRDLDALSNEGEDFVVFLEPPAIDDRIVNQHALFSVVAGRPNPQRVSRITWFERHPSLLKKIMIPAALKQEIRDKLDQANITERVLYPGLDGLTKWLVRYYTPRNPPKRTTD